MIIISIFILSFFSLADLSSLIDDISKQTEINQQLKIISENQDVLLIDSLILSEKLLLSLNDELETTKKIINNEYKFDYYYLLSKLNKEIGEIEKAIDYNYQAFSIAEEEGLSKQLALTYLQFGELYIKIKDFDQASKYNLLGLRFCEDRKDTTIKYKFMFLLGKISYSIGNYDDAETYMLGALSETVGKNEFNIIAEIKLYLSRIYIATNQLDKAELNLLSVEMLSSQINNITLLTEIYRELVSLYIILNDEVQALKYALLALENVRKLSDLELRADVKLITAKLLYKMNNIEESKKYLDLITDYINQTNNLIHKADYYNLYSKLMIKNNDYKSAYQMQEKFLKIKDTIINESKIAAINDALKKYESEKKDRENEMLKLDLKLSNKQKEFTTYVIIGVLIAIIVVGFFAILLYLRAKKERKMNNLLSVQNNKIEAQKEELELLNKELVDRNVEIEEINSNLIKSEAESRELNATKDKFLSIIAHDLKNPIAGIMLTSELLVNYYDKLDKDKLETKLIEINTTTVKLKDLLDTLLEWARASTGNIPYNPYEVDVDTILKNLGNLFSANLQNKNINFEVENNTNCKVIADEKMLDTILRNITSNAIKFTPEGGSIFISTQNLVDKLQINIKDTGIGIPEDKIPDLFSMSSNYSTLGTQKEKGTGLGLLLCKEFIEINNGSILVSSEIGKGTTFSIILNRVNYNG